MCIHHWQIDDNSDEFSKGYCVKCGESREFRNQLPEVANFGETMDFLFCGDSERLVISGEEAHYRHINQIQYVPNEELFLRTTRRNLMVAGEQVC